MSEVVARRRRFAQIPDALIADPRLSSHAIRVWARLDRYAGAGGGALPSRETLADDLGLSVDIVKRSFAELTRCGWISRARISSSNVWNTVLNDEPAEAESAPSAGRPPAGTRVVRQRRPSSEESCTGAPLPDEKSCTGAPLPDQGEPGNGARNGAPVRRPRKEKTRREEMTTSSLESAQPATLDVATDATPAATDSASRRPASTRGTRLPPTWQPSPELREWTRQNAPGIGWADVEKFRDHWTAEAGQRAVKLDWDATWRNWVRREVRGMPGRAPGNRKPTMDDVIAENAVRYEEMRRREQAAIAQGIDPLTLPIAGGSL